MSSQRVPRCSKNAARALSGSNYTDRTKEGSVKPSVATKRSLGCPREGAGGPAPGVVPGFVWKWGLRHEVFPYIRMFKFHENELLFFCEEEETEAQNIHTSLLSSFLTLRSLSFTVRKSRRVSRDRRRSRLRCSAPMPPFHPPLSQFVFPTDSGFSIFSRLRIFTGSQKVKVRLTCARPSVCLSTSWDTFGCRPRQGLGGVASRAPGLVAVPAAVLAGLLQCGAS